MIDNMVDAGVASPWQHRCHRGRRSYGGCFGVVAAALGDRMALHEIE
jgi:hypothetical protein